MSVPGPVLGPCVAWVDGDDVALCCNADYGSNAAVLDTVALEASMVLYEISGRQFPGQCEQTVRPCRQPCGCWGQPSSGIGPWFWPTAAWGYAPGWYWYNDCGDRLGCRPMSRVKLAGYPVTAIQEVKIDGVVLDPLDANGNPNYRLDEWQWLTRMDDPGPPVAPRRWPGCQNLSLDDAEPGTFAVSYGYGVDPPQIGKDAAAELACELFKACSAQACAVPANAVKIQRQGIQIERDVLIAFLDPKKPSGLTHLDLFVAAYNAARISRRPALFSPDVQAYARRLG
jgi:hypothetical protein